MASDLFRKMANTLSSLTESDFQDKLQLFINIHALIKTNKPVRLVQQANDTQNNHLAPNSCADSSEIESTTQASSSLLLHASTDAPPATHQWSSLRLPAAVKKRGRPKENKGYFQSFHKQLKKARVEPVSSVVQELLDEEDAIRQEEENLNASSDDRPALIDDIDNRSSPPISPAEDSSIICVEPVGVAI